MSAQDSKQPPTLAPLGDQLQTLEVYGRLGGLSSTEVTRQAERERCAKICEAEAERVRALLEVCDISGKPIFNREQTEAGIAALLHAAQLIREGK
jgi:tRNA A37 N6-isopentenylltransferase MiaA